jgi:multidrug transporter EmrE-like cation transporter
MAKDGFVFTMLFYILLIVLFDVLAQGAFKTCHINNDKKSYFLGLLFYAVVGFFLLRAYEYGNMGTVNVIWGAISIISVMLVGKFYFDEHISTSDIIGAVFVFIGLIIMLYDEITSSGVSSVGSGNGDGGNKTE